MEEHSGRVWQSSCQKCDRSHSSYRKSLPLQILNSKCAVEDSLSHPPRCYGFRHKRIWSMLANAIRRLELDKFRDEIYKLARPRSTGWSFVNEDILPLERI